MEYNLYCDESRHTSDASQRYAVIGALQCPRSEKRSLVSSIHHLKAKYNAQGEFGWKRLSPNKAEFYQELLTLFISSDALNFRCIVVDRSSLNHDEFNEGDSELGFYKLYYQMLVHWLKPGSSYFIYLDWQQNSCTDRFSSLRQVLINKLIGRANIEALEPVESDTQPLVQLADLLIGAVGYHCNALDKLETASATKINFCRVLSESLERSDLTSPTYKSESKFNIFHWQGR
ncbi:MAG: hypothetical protein ACI9XU_000111 [Arenicella sp.]